MSKVQFFTFSRFELYLYVSNRRVKTKVLYKSAARNVLFSIFCMTMGGQHPAPLLGTLLVLHKHARFFVQFRLGGMRVFLFCLTLKSKPTYVLILYPFFVHFFLFQMLRTLHFGNTGFIQRSHHTVSKLRQTVSHSYKELDLPVE